MPYPRMEIPTDELRIMVAQKMTSDQIAAHFGCSDRTIDSRIAEMKRGENYGSPDYEFDRRMGECRFEDDPRAPTPSLRAPRIWPHISGHARSYTGCAASLCV